jgi:hypothetical protein
MLYRVYVQYQGSMIMASQHNCPNLCLDKYRRLQKQGHTDIKIDIQENS